VIDSSLSTKERTDTLRSSSKSQHINPKAKNASLIAESKKDAKKKGKHGEMVAAAGKDGKVRSFVSLDEKLVPLKMRQIEVNSVVVIVSGRHEGMIGRAIHVWKDQGEAQVQLTKSEENVKVPLSGLRLYEIDDDDNETELNKDSEKPVISASSKSIKKEESKTRASKSPSNDKKKDDKDSKKKKIKWATPNIRVRIISDKFRDGKLYNSKVVITDILDRYSFVAVTTKGELLEDLREKEIETVLPKEGERVKILKGEYAGKLGKLVKRDKSNDQVCIELEETGDFVKVSQDDCAEFVANNM